MPETRHFINSGYGWTCKRCCAADKDAHDTDANADNRTRARFFHEGEAEEREPTLAAQALARWRDASQDTLVCPRCGAEEETRGDGDAATRRKTEGAP